MRLVSIILPAFNTEYVLPAAIDSCLEQNLGENMDIEIIVVDDGSLDNTKAVAADFAEKHECVKLIALEQNCGTFAARIEGIKTANGEFVMFLDSDDKLPSDAVRLFVESALACEKIPDMVFADRITHGEQTQKITYNFKHLKAPYILRGNEIFNEVFAQKTW